jgi:hypothetical protein
MEADYRVRRTLETTCFTSDRVAVPYQAFGEENV